MARITAGEDAPLLKPVNDDGRGDGKNVNDDPAASASPDRKKQRLVSLDATRGLTVIVMIFVDNVGGVLQGRVNHSAWNHVTFADFVMPFFLFMVGMSMSMSFQKYQKGLVKKVLLRTVKLFVLGLLTQGGDFPELYTGDCHDDDDASRGGYNLQKLRIGGILQRIAFAYCITAFLAMYMPKLADSWRGRGLLGWFRLFRVYFFHWLVALSFLFLYIALTFGVHVPTYSFETTAIPRGTLVDNCTLIEGYTHKYTCTVSCDTSGDLTPACSAIRLVDNALLGGYQHMYDGGEFRRLSECNGCFPDGVCPLPANVSAAPWCFSRLDPEGAMSSFPTVLTAWMGFFFGSVLVMYKSHKERLTLWSLLSVASFVLGIVIHAAGWLMNKQTWSPSYLFMMAGSTGFISMLFYVLLDVLPGIPSLRIANKLTMLLRPFIWVGMNTILIYLLSPAAGIMESIQTFVYYGDGANNFVQTMFNYVFCKDPFCPVSLNATAVCDGTDTMDCGPECLSRTCDGGIFNGSEYKWAVVFFTIVRIVFWVIIAYILHRNKYYVAL